MLVSPRHPPLPLLVTGITGVTGYSALAYFQQRYPGQVVGIRPPQTWRLVGPGIVALDLEDTEGLDQLFRTWRFRAILNCAGNCALKPCERVPEMAWKLNVASAINLAQRARAYDARLIHLSSDLVFSGVGSGGYRETDPVDPVTVYGKTMAEGEQVVHQLKPSAAILRVSLPMGPSFNGHAGAIDWIQSRFRANRPATLYYDEVRSSTYVEDMSRVFAWFLAHEVEGLFHAGGPRPLALYQIAQVINRVGGYDPTCLQGCYRIEAGPMPPRAGNVSMNSDKLINLLGGQPFHPWPLEEELIPTDRDWHFRRSPDEVGSVAHITERLYDYPDQWAPPAVPVVPSPLPADTISPTR